MSKAKEEFYRQCKIAEESFGGFAGYIYNYIKELEKQNEKYRNGLLKCLESENSERIHDIIDEVLKDE